MSSKKDTNYPVKYTLFGFEEEEIGEEQPEQDEPIKKKRLLTAKELINLAKWNGFTCVIDKVQGKERVFVTWEGSFFSHDLGWVTEIQAAYTNPNAIIELFKTTKKKAEEVA